MCLASHYDVLAAFAFLVTGALTGCADPHRDPEEIVSAMELLMAPPKPLSVSPDGELLLLQTRAESEAFLQVMRFSDQEIVASYGLGKPMPPYAPTWAPDSRRIALWAGTDGVFQLRLWDLGSESVRVLNAPESFHPLGPQWSRDGERLLVLIHPPRGSTELETGGRELYWIDASGEEEPRKIATGLGNRLHLSLAPDGKQIAMVHATEPSTVVIQGKAEFARFPLGSGTEFRTIGWAPDSRSLLLSIRRPGEEYYRIEALDIGTGVTEELASMNADLSSAGYLSDGRLFFQANMDGLSRTRICDQESTQRIAHEDGAAEREDSRSEADLRRQQDRSASPGRCRWLAPDGYASKVAKVNSKTDSALVILTGPNEPPALHAVDLRTGSFSPVYAPTHSFEMPNMGGVSMEVGSSDGFRVPAYLWTARRVPGDEPAAFIHVPGGPGLQEPPYWAPHIAYLVSRGFDFIYVNYRGQIGYGAEFERAPGGMTARADDVLAVRDYVITQMGVPADRVVLYGHSYGAPVVVHAVTRSRLSSPVILASMTSLDLSGLEPMERCVIAFHGDEDPMASSDVARAQIEHAFGPRALKEPCGHFRFLPKEWHLLEGATAFAEVFSSAVTALATEGPETPSP